MASIRSLDFYITKAIAAVLQLGKIHGLLHTLQLYGETRFVASWRYGGAIDATPCFCKLCSKLHTVGFLALCFMTYTMGRDLELLGRQRCCIWGSASVTTLPVLWPAKFTSLYRRQVQIINPRYDESGTRVTGRYGPISRYLRADWIQHLWIQSSEYFRVWLHKDANSLPAEKMPWTATQQAMRIFDKYFISWWLTRSFLALKGKETKDEIEGWWRWKRVGIDRLWGLQSLGAWFRLRLKVAWDKHQMIV